MTDRHEIEVLVDRELKKISDDALLTRLRQILVTPYPVQRAWDYGAPDQEYECWTVAEHPSSNTAIAYSSEGFGPGDPWGLVAIRGEYTGIGMDSGWFLTLEDAFRNSSAWDGENPPGYEVS